MNGEIQTYSVYDKKEPCVDIMCFKLFFFFQNADI